MDSLLHGKAIVITGAGSGIGAAYARHAASLGAAVLVNDIDPAAAERVAAAIGAAGGQAAALAGDVADWGLGERLVEACVDRFGAFTGLVNNAGILRHGRVEAIQEADLRRMLEVNVVGTAACGSAAVRRLLALGKGGAIVNVASGSQAGDIALGGYGASKAAIATLTYSWALELRGSFIRVNAVSPLADTAMSAQNAQWAGQQAASRDVQYATLPDPAVNAPVVSFLLSDAASRVNGQVVRIANGELSFMTHPMVAAPVLRGDWPIEAVIEAFATVLEASQQRLGLAYAGGP